VSHSSGVSAHMLSSIQKSGRSCWNTLRRSILRPGLPSLPILILGMSLCHQTYSRYITNTVHYPLEKIIILHQSISRRMPTLDTEVPRTNKISIIRELGVLTNMPDEGSLTVRRFSTQPHLGLIEYRFSTKSSI